MYLFLLKQKKCQAEVNVYFSISQSILVKLVIILKENCIANFVEGVMSISITRNFCFTDFVQSFGAFDFDRTPRF